MFGDAALFFGLWLQKPLQIAAITSSGARLATVSKFGIAGACLAPAGGPDLGLFQCGRLNELSALG
jgi:hypothetical protein